MPMSAAMKQLVATRADLSKMRSQAVRDGMKPLRIAGARKVAAGLTTIAEVLKAAPPADLEGG
jgi:general secretion pathway protein E